MVVVLLVVLLVVGRLVSAVELGNNSCLAQVDVLGGLSAVDIVSAVGVQSPHLVEIKGFRVLCVLVRPLAVLSVDVKPQKPWALIINALPLRLKSP